MLDANGAALPKGTLFFAEVYFLNNKLIKLGIKSSELLYCRKIDDAYESDFTIFINKEWIKIDGHSEIGDYGYIVYSGMTDLSGFIDDSRKEEAKNFLIKNELWEEMI